MWLHCSAFAILLTIAYAQGLTPNEQCKKDKEGLIPDPTKCQTYYDCAHYVPAGLFFGGGYEKECWYPQLFDINKLKCVPYKQATCGAGRKEAKWECEYRSYQTHGRGPPCPLDHPSCLGKANGSYHHPMKEWSPYYVQCESERSTAGRAVLCPKHSVTKTQMIFHKTKRMCVTKWEIPTAHGGIQPSCEGKRDAMFYKTTDNPGVFYLCPSKKVFFCSKGYSFDEFAQGCYKN